MSNFWTIERVRTLEFIAKFDNHWRRQTIEVYGHPEDPDRVFLVKIPFDGAFSSAPEVMTEQKVYMINVDFDNKLATDIG